MTLLTACCVVGEISSRKPLPLSKISVTPVPNPSLGGDPYLDLG